MWDCFRYYLQGAPACARSHSAQYELPQNWQVRAYAEEAGFVADVEAWLWEVERSFAAHAGFWDTQSRVLPPPHWRGAMVALCQATALTVPAGEKRTSHV